MTRTGSAQVLPHLGAFINDVSGLQCLRYVANYSIEACNVFGASQTMQHRAPRRPLEEEFIYASGDMAVKTGAFDDVQLGDVEITVGLACQVP